MTHRHRIGIFGGSFNPVHIGHLMLASYIAQCGLVDQVWLSLSPCNPLKAGQSMASDAHRLEMLRIALAKASRIKLCSVELDMPRPSYTVDTMRRLEAENPECDFTLIVGGDNLTAFHKWKDHTLLLDRYGLIVYPRPGFETPTSSTAIRIVDAPMVDISSTWIRDCIARGLDMNFFLPTGVYDYILKHRLYHGND